MILNLSLPSHRFTGIPKLPYVLMTTDLKIDLLSVAIAGLVCSMTGVANYFEIVDSFVLSRVIRLCVQVPKTSKFEMLKNKPLKFIEQTFPIDSKELNQILQKINKDSNLEYFGVNKDISQIIKCIFDGKEEFLVEAMDNLVISKRGVEILIFKFEKAASSESYDCSIFVDITSFRETVFQLRGLFMITSSLIALLLASSDGLRSVIAKQFN